MGKLVGRRIVVVGASAGIGRSFAELAIADGAQVIACARRADKLNELVVDAANGTALSIDISNVEDCARLADAASAALGSIDLVFHAAGSAPLKKMADMTADDWQFVMSVNVIGVHQVIAALLPVLEPGGIVSVLSSETVGQPARGWGVTARARRRSKNSCGRGTPRTPVFGSRVSRSVRPCPPSSDQASTCSCSAK